MKINYQYIIIGVLIWLLILQNQCSKPNSQDPSITIERDTTYITITKTDSIKDPYPVFIKQTKWDTIKQIDTIKVLGDYFSIKAFTQIYQYGDTLKLIITDTISQNTLIHQDIKYELNIPIIREKITIIQNPHELYAGPKVGFIGDKIQLGLDLTYRNPYGQLFTLYYSPFNQNIGMGVQFRLFKVNIKEKNLPLNL